MTVVSINPTTGETLETFAETTPAALERVLDEAVDTYQAWRRCSYAHRAKLVREAARLLRERKSQHARTMALEMGKPLPQGEAEAEKCAWVCDYYAEHAERFLADEPRNTDASKAFVRVEPIGPVLAIMPWNFPFWQVFRFAAPALMAGNAGLLKHAPNVTRCALGIEAIFQEAGFAERLFLASILSNEAAATVIADPRVRAVTLTGSDRAGSQVAEQAGRHLKKTVLELGGSDPFIVLEDADVALAARTAAEARLLNSGQSCIAAKRFIVVEPVADRFLDAFVAAMRTRRMGDPLALGTQVGPQARHDLRANLHRQVEESVRRGARARGGLGLRERTREVRSPAAVRGHQALGLRARAVGVRAQGVRQHQDGLGGVRVHVGTSGYNFPEWKGTFYPAKFPESQMLEYYAQRLATVEVNYTFYRMPNAKTVTGWDAATPAGFTFVLKAPQRITHIARLKDIDDPLRFFLDTARKLGPKLGPLLFQLPPNFKKDV